MRRTPARVSARQSPSVWIRSSMRREASSPVPRFASAPGLAFAPAFAVDRDVAAGLRGLLAGDVILAFGFALLGMPRSLRDDRGALGGVSEPRGRHAAL